MRREMLIAVGLLGSVMAAEFLFGMEAAGILTAAIVTAGIGFAVLYPTLCRKAAIPPGSEESSAEDMRRHLLRSLGSLVNWPASSRNRPF